MFVAPSFYFIFDK